MWATPLLETLSWLPTAFKNTFLRWAHRPFMISLPSTSLASSLATHSSSILYSPSSSHYLKPSDTQSCYFIFPEMSSLHVFVSTCSLSLRALGNVIFPRKPSKYSSFPPKYQDIFTPPPSLLQAYFWDRTFHTVVSSQMNLVLLPLYPKFLESHH